MLLFIGVIYEFLGVGINKLLENGLSLFEMLLPDKNIPTFPGIKNIHNLKGLNTNILLIKGTQHTNTISPPDPFDHHTIPNPNGPLIPIHIHKPIGHKLHDQFRQQIILLTIMHLKQEIINHAMQEEGTNAAVEG